MRHPKGTIYVSAALMALLPAVASAQDAGTALDQPVATTEMGVTEVTPTSANEPMSLSDWSYDDIYANGVSIEQMIGADVYGPEGDDIGDVENVLFDMDGQVLSIVAEIGGFLDIGDTHVNIPWEMVSAEDWTDGIMIPFTEDQVEDYTAEASYYGTDAEFYGADEGVFGNDAMVENDTMLGNDAMVENDAMAGNEVVGAEQIAEVGGDGAGVVETGPNVWRAGDLLNNTARLRDGEAYANYGMVSDIIVRDGQIAAVLVSSDATAGGTPGLYGYPYAGTGGWMRGEGATGTYDLPYDRTEADMMQPFDPAMLTD